MIVLHRRTIQEVAAHWKAQYCHDGKWGSTISGPAEETYRKILECQTDAEIDALLSGSESLKVVGFLPCYHHAAAEKTIHCFLKSKRVHGEWFRINAHDIETSIRHWATEIDSPIAANDAVPSSGLLEMMA